MTLIERIEAMEQALAELREAATKPAKPRHPTTTYESPAEGFMSLDAAVKILADEEGTQAELSDTTGVDKSYISRLIAGEKINPSDETLDQLGLVRFVRVSYQFRDQYDL